MRSNTQWPLGIGAWCAVGGCAVLPVSTPATHICFLLAVFFSYFCSDVRCALKAMFQQWWTPRVALWLWLCILVGMYYSSGLWSERLTFFFKYSKLLYLIFLIPIFASSDIVREYGRRAFVMSSVVVLCLLFLVHGFGMNFLHEKIRYLGGGGLFRDYLATSSLMLFAGMALFHGSLEKKGFEVWLDRGLLGLMLVYFFAISYSRTTLVLLLCMMMYYVYQWRKVFWAMVKQNPRRVLMVILVFSMGVGVLSQQKNLSVNKRICQTYEETTRALTEGWWVASSVGERLHFSRESLMIWKRSFWVGHGTGSYQHEYLKSEENRRIGEGISRRNPHNEYFNLAVPLGLLGFLSMLLLFFAHIRDSFCIKNTDRLLMHGVLLMACVGSLSLSWLMDTASGFIFVLGTVWCLGSAQFAQSKVQARASV